MPLLPLEIALEVLDHVGQPTRDDPIALRASHITTQMLLSFTRVCKATSHRARCYLLSRCLFIDSSTRLRQLLSSLENSDHRNGFQTREALQSISSMYLAPFAEHNIDDLPTAQWTLQLLSLVAPTLERLVIRINLSALEPWSDHLNVIPTLRTGFERLTNLREFTSTASDLYFPHFVAGSSTPPVWCRWQKLERLGLFNPGMSRLAAMIGTGTLHLPPGLSRIAFGFGADRTDGNARALAQNHQILLMLPSAERIRLLVIHPAVPAQHRNVLEHLHGYSFLAGHGEGPIEVVGRQAPDPSAGMSVRELCEYYHVYFQEEALSRELWHLGGLFLGERKPGLLQELP